MKILITGGCGFVGSNLAIFLKKKIKKSTIVSLDNLSRSGSVLNCARLKKNNPVLIGEAGAGKTSVVEMLATMIHKNECPRKLLGKRLLATATTALAGL